MDSGVILYRRYLDGDNSALEQLVQDYGNGLVRFAYVYVRDSSAAEDIMEDTFATLIIKRKRFSEVASFKTYLYKIARNKCIDRLRFNKRFVPFDDVENVLSSGCDVERDVLQCERFEELYRCIDKLPRQYKDVLSLVYLEEFSISQTSDIMGRSVKQIYNLLCRAKSALKELLKNEGVSNEE